MRDDFSLGDLTDRITELEEETAKGMEGGKDAANKKMGQEDFVPKALPPFPELRYLNLAYNQVGEQDKFIVTVSAWLVLCCLNFLDVPLVELMYIVFAPMTDESCCRCFRPLSLNSCDISQAVITFFCSFILPCLFVHSIFFFIRILSNFSSLKALTLLVHAVVVFWCFRKPPRHF